MFKSVQASQNVFIAQEAEPTEVEGLAATFSRATISTPIPTRLSSLSTSQSIITSSGFFHVPPPSNAQPLKGILKKPTAQFPLFTDDIPSPRRKPFGNDRSHPEDVSCHGGRQKSMYSRKTHQPYSVQGRGDSQPPRPVLFPYPGPTTTRDPWRRPVPPAPSNVNLSCMEEATSNPAIYSDTRSPLADDAMCNNLAATGEEPIYQQDMSNGDCDLPDHEEDKEVTTLPPYDAEIAADEEDNEQVFDTEQDGDAGGLENTANGEEEMSQLLYDILYASDSDDEYDSTLDAGPSQGPSLRAVSKGKMVDPSERGGQPSSHSDPDSTFNPHNGHDTDVNVTPAQQPADPPPQITVVTEEDVDCHFLWDTIEAIDPDFLKSSSELPSSSSSPSSTSTHSPSTPSSSPPPPPHSPCSVQKYKDTEATIIEHKPSWLPNLHIASLELMDIEMEDVEVKLDDDAMDTTEDFPSQQSPFVLYSPTLGAS